MGSVTNLAVSPLTQSSEFSALGSDFSGLGGTAHPGRRVQKKGWRLTSPCPLYPGLLAQAQAEAGSGKLVPVADTKAGMENGTGRQGFGVDSSLESGTTRLKRWA